MIFNIVIHKPQGKMVKTFPKPITFQFYLIAGSKAASAPSVRGMHGERMDTQKGFHHQTRVQSFHVSRSSGSVL